MRDSAMPEAHEPWCRDRLKPRSQDHWTVDGDSCCISDELDAGQSWMFLIQTEQGGINLVLDGVERPLNEAAADLASVSAAAIILAAIA